MPWYKLSDNKLKETSQNIDTKKTTFRMSRAFPASWCTIDQVGNYFISCKLIRNLFFKITFVALLYCLSKAVDFEWVEYCAMEDGELVTCKISYMC